MKSLPRYQAQALALVNARVGDARAHALSYLAQPAGRPAEIVRRRVAAVHASKDVLAKLQFAFADLVGDEREQLYRESRAAVLDRVPLAHRGTLDQHPDPDRLYAARQYQLHGTDAASRLTREIKSAIRSLDAIAVTSSLVGPAQLRASIDRWADETAAAIYRRADLIIGDSAILVERLAMVDVASEVYGPEPDEDQ